MKAIWIWVFLLPSLVGAQSWDLDDPDILDRFREAPLEVSVEEGVGTTLTPSSCNFEVTDRLSRFQQCACTCLEEGTSPDQMQECIKNCRLPGTFDEEGNYIPSDPAVQKLEDAHDFKTFYDYSLRGHGGAAGVAWEMSDGMARVPWGPRRIYQKADSVTGDCGDHWKKESNGMCSRGFRENITSELALSQQAFGAHLGIKFVPVVDFGAFAGVKWNFEEEEIDFTLGIQWIKLSF